MLLGEGSGKVAVPLPQKKINLGLQYTICGAFRAFFQFSLAGFNASNVLDDFWIIYLFFISTSGGREGAVAIPGPSLNPPLMNTQTVSCRRSASWAGLSDLAEYTAVWAADSVVGRRSQRTSVVSTHRWLVSSDASWVRRPATSAPWSTQLTVAWTCRDAAVYQAQWYYFHALNYANCIEYDTYSIV